MMQVAKGVQGAHACAIKVLVVPMDCPPPPPPKVRRTPRRATASLAPEKEGEGGLP